jgi:hypothetical protein
MEMEMEMEMKAKAMVTMVTAELKVIGSQVPGVKLTGMKAAAAKATG